MSMASVNVEFPEIFLFSSGILMVQVFGKSLVTGELEELVLVLLLELVIEL